jgi:hypothetical protein
MVFRRILPLMLAFCFVLIPQSILAQQKIPIELKFLSDDPVGKKLVTRIEDDIQKSATLEVTSNTDLPRLKITIVTLDPYKTEGSTIYSLIIVASEVYFDDIFISSGIGVCGLNKISDVSQNILADIDKNTKSFQEAKKNWDYFGEVLKGEKQKLIEQITKLRNKINELDDQLKIEKAKSWWMKLKETLQGR